MKTHIPKLILLLLFSLSLVACGSNNDSKPPDAGPTIINISAIAGVTAPVRGDAPVTSITETAQYTGTVAWSPAVSGEFAAKTVYTATITLAPKTGFTLQGVAANFFKVAGATATNAANSGVVVAAFPATGIPDPEWEVPGDYSASIDVFDGVTSIGTIELTTASLAGVEQVIFETTSTPARELAAYRLMDVLEAAGIDIPAEYDKVAGQREVVLDPINDVTEITDITKAYVIVARIDEATPTTYSPSRIVADGTVDFDNSAVRQGFEQLVFTPPVEPEPDWEIPETYAAAIEVFDGATLIDTITLTKALLEDLEQVILESTSTPPRELVSYRLMDVLEAAGIDIPSLSAEAKNAAETETLPIDDIRTSYVVIARIDDPTVYDPARIIADGTGAFANSAIWSGFAKLVFDPFAWEIPASYNSAIEVFDGATLIGTMEFSSAALAGVDQVLLKSTQGRWFVTYLLTDLLDAAGISIPAVFASLAGQPAIAEPSPSDVTEIADITKAYVVIARIEMSTPETYDPPRIIADGTGVFGNNVVRSGFEQLVFTP